MVRLATFLLLIVLGAGSASAQTKLGPEFIINNRVVDVQAGRDVATLANGDVVAVWTDLNSANEVRRLVARRYDASGVAKGLVVLVHEGDTSSAGVAGLADGGFVVVFRTTAGNRQVRARIYDASGEPTGPEFRVSQTQIINGNASVAALPNGGFVVAWGNNLTTDDMSAEGKVFARRFRADGTPAGGQFQVNTVNSLSAALSNLDIAPFDGNGFVIVWERRSRGEAQIYGRVFPEVGTPPSERRINLNDGRRHSAPRVAALSGGGFVVAWTKDFLGIFAKRFDIQGRAVGSDFQVNEADQDDYGNTAVAGLSGNEFVIAWQSVTYEPVSDEFEMNVLARRFDSAGQPLSGDFGVNTSTPSRQSPVGIAPLSSGQFLATWNTYGEDFYGQIFGP